MNDCPEKHHLLIGNGGQCPPYTSFHNLRVDQRPLSDSSQALI